MRIQHRRNAQPYKDLAQLLGVLHNPTQLLLAMEDLQDGEMFFLRYFDDEQKIKTVQVNAAVRNDEVYLDFNLPKIEETIQPHGVMITSITGKKYVLDNLEDYSSISKLLPKNIVVSGDLRNVIVKGAPQEIDTLESIIFCNGVGTIDWQVNNRNVQSIVFPDSLIKLSGFNNNPKLASLDLSMCGHLQEVSGFRNTGLVSINWPEAMVNSIKLINFASFCTSLSSVDFNISNTTGCTNFIVEDDADLSKSFINCDNWKYVRRGRIRVGRTITRPVVFSGSSLEVALTRLNPEARTNPLPTHRYTFIDA